MSVALCFICLLISPENAQASSSNLNTVSSSALFFIENKGQVTDQFGIVRNDIDFKINAAGLNIFIGDGQIHYQWQKEIAPNGFETAADNNKEQQFQSYRLDMKLVGANTHAVIESKEDMNYTESYYLPGKAKKTTARSNRRIIYKDVYPSIDWVLYISNGGLKYDFNVRAGGDVSNIKMEYSGATRIEAVEGSVIIETPFGKITEHKPYSYERGSNKEVVSSFQLNNSRLSFKVVGQPSEFVIDPELEWSTYYGGNGPEGAWNLVENGIMSAIGGSVADANGNVYMVNSTSSGGNIATSGAYETSFSSVCGFITKFKPDGTRDWGTYYSNVVLYRASCDADNNVYVCGVSNNKFASVTTGCHQDTSNGFNDGFIAKFNSSGERVWATYYGGENQDYLLDIKAVAGNRIYVGGYTNSKSYIAIAGAFQDTLKNGNNTLLAQFDTTGKRLWATYYPSNMKCNILSLCLDKTDGLYVCGSTDSAEAMPVLNSHQPVFGGSNDGFLVKFDTAGNKLWSTYYGGNSIDHALSVTCDTGNDVYICGLSYSNSGISTVGSYQQNLIGKRNAFVSKFSTLGQLLWSSYYPVDNFTGITIDKYQDICLVGIANDAAHIATGGAWQSSNKGGEDGVFVKFNNKGQHLWSTYIGGAKLDIPNAVVNDADGNIYISGVTESMNGISTSASHQPICGGGYDAFLLKARPDSALYLAIPFNDTAICLTSTGASISVGYNVSRTFNPGNIFTVELSDATGNFNTPLVIGTAASTVSGYITCNMPPATIHGKQYRVRIIATAPAYVSDDNGTDIEITGMPVKPDISGDTVLCAGEQLILSVTMPASGFSWTGPSGYTSSSQSIKIAPATKEVSGDYIVTVAPYRCAVSDTIHVRVKPMPLKPAITHNAPLCSGDTLILKYAIDTPGILYSINWPHPPLVQERGLLIDKATEALTGSYVVTADKEGCMVRDTTAVVIKKLPAIAVSSNSPVIRGDRLKLNAGGDTARSAVYSWIGPGGFVSSVPNPVIYPTLLKHAGTYALSIEQDGCTSSGETAVVINEPGMYVYTIFPNPNKGTFTIQGNVTKDYDAVPIEIYNSAGQTVWKDEAITLYGQINKTIILNPVPANGVYFLKMMINGKSKVLPFTINK